MKVGITSFGAYIPYYRIMRSTIAGAWEGKGPKGEISVANNDEDSVTMSVEAAAKCVREIDKDQVDLVYFASVTAPYAEKGQAGIIAGACDLREEINTADYAHSLRSGTNALNAAADAVKAGSARQALVVAADCRAAYPKSSKEQMLGDASAAVMFGSENIIAELEYRASVSNEIIDYWRNYGERYVNCAEARFASDMGYSRSMKKVIGDILQKARLKPTDIARIVLTTPGMKDGSKLAAKTGFTEDQILDPLMNQVGDCGSAQALLLLAAALETAQPGERILLAAYGSGADAFIFRVTESIKPFVKRQLVKRYLETKRYLSSYTRFLSFRNLVDTVPGEPFRTFPSNSAYWRDQRSIIRFRGSRCTACGTTIFPVQRICCQCGAKDQFTEICLSQRTAKVFTYSIDNLAGRSDDPVVVQTVSEDQEGVRYYNLMTDFAKDEVRVGLEVEFTFRKIYEGGNYINYFWKCRPVRNEGDAK